MSSAVKWIFIISLAFNFQIFWMSIRSLWKETSWVHDLSFADEIKWRFKLIRIAASEFEASIINPLQTAETDYGHPWLKYFLKWISCRLWLYQPPQPVAYLWDVLGAGPYAIYHRLYLCAGREEYSVSVGTGKRRVFVHVAKRTGLPQLPSKGNDIFCTNWQTGKVYSSWSAYALFF
jgi:hypothetical protein